jgi:hypothetical protein
VQKADAVLPLISSLSLLTMTMMTVTVLVFGILMMMRRRIAALMSG